MSVTTRITNMTTLPMPSRKSPSTIEDRVDGVMAEFPNFGAELNSISDEINDSLAALAIGDITGTDVVELVDGSTTTLHKHDIVEDETPQLFDDLDGQGNYLVDTQNIPDILAGRGPGYWFDGASVISVSGQPIGAQDFSLSFLILPDFATELMLFGGGVTRPRVQITTAGLLGIRLTNGGTSINSTTPLSPNVYSYVMYVRSSGVGTWYINGVSAGGGADSNSYLGISEIGYNPYSAQYYTGFLQKVQVKNLALSEAEVKAFSSGSPIPYKYIGASQISRIVDTVINNGSYLYPTFSGASASGFHAEGDGSGSALYIINSDTSIHIIAGKRYRFSFTGVIASGTAASFGLFNNSVASATVAGTSVQTMEVGSNIYEFTATTTVDAVMCFYNAQGVLDYTVSDLSITQIGCVLDLNPDGVTDDTWYDHSGNELNGAVSSAVASNKQAVATDGTDGFVDGVLNLTGGQLAFPATAVPSSDPNTLDDYEEGTWTPTLNRLTTPGTHVYTEQTGLYTKIGNICTVGFVLSKSSTSAQGSGFNVLGTLPFSGSANIEQPGSIGLNTIFDTAISTSFYMGRLSTNLAFYGTGSISGAISTAWSTGAGSVTGTLTYTID